MSEYNLTASALRIFRSYTRPNNEMPNCPKWQAIRASMAHPALFKSVVIGDGVMGESLVGGDVGCSNPTRHVLGEVSTTHSDRTCSNDRDSSIKPAPSNDADKRTDSDEKRGYGLREGGAGDGSTVSRNERVLETERNQGM
ncbi:kinesin light chain [Ceratobasidium sp. AG-Ba]|nr:kinesin light chain [Ceratobasidium sp. AG-Ba]